MNIYKYEHNPSTTASFLSEVVAQVQRDVIVAQAALCMHCIVHVLYFFKKSLTPKKSHLDPLTLHVEIVIADVSVRGGQCEQGYFGDYVIMNRI